MLTAEAMSNLSDLSKLSKTLNEESNKVNEILLEFEQKLVAMNIGVEAWVELTSEPYVEGDEGSIQCSSDIVLGFGQRADDHQLLIKTIDYVEEVGNYGQYHWKKRQEYGIKPLLKASREIRVKALEKLKELLDALMAEGNNVLKAIEKGRKTVDNLKAD